MNVTQNDIDIRMKLILELLKELNEMRESCPVPEVHRLQWGIHTGREIGDGAWLGLGEPYETKDPDGPDGIHWYRSQFCSY